MFNYFKQKNKNKSGFTLVETLIAISIFSMSIVALMSVLATGIADTNYAKNKIIASYLAEEGIEYIKNMRDTYVIYGSTSTQGWNDFKLKIQAQPACKSVSGIGCNFSDSLGVFDIATLQSSMNFSSCDNNNACSLYYYNTLGKYSYNHSLPGVDSGFTRKIMVTESANNPLELKVTSVVSWSKNSISYNVAFSDNLLKWKE
ncbi:MAG: type II secretion system protein [Patescibacteria group bacterium]